MKSFEHIDLFSGIKHFFRNVMNKSNIMWHPDLKLGSYVEIDEKLLYCCFNELVEYVEVECAHMEQISKWGDEFPLNHIRKTTRSVEDGLNYLYNAYEDGWDIINLYIWWTKERPSREMNRKVEKMDWCTVQEDYEEDTQKLVELIKLRKFLWT